MLKNKKIVALLLCLVILSQGANVMAVSFSDVTKSGDSGWAYEYIIDLANKGIINGYDDGTYKPKANVSILETISLLYGVMDPSQSEVNDALAKHKDYIKTNLSDVNWGQERLAYAIEKGVVTKTDLEDAHKAGMLKNGTKIYASRYSVAIMTARALDLEAKTSYNLTYKDLDKINKDSRGLIAALIDTEVLHKDGIDGNFAPNESITRAQMAKMISIAYNWKNKNAKNLETKTESGKVVEVLDFDDYKSLVYSKEYANVNTSAKVDKNTKLTDKDGKTVALKDLSNYKGAKVTVTYTGSHPDKKATEVKFTSDASYADGVFTLVSFRTANNKNYIKLKDSKGNTLDEVQSLYDFAEDGSNKVSLSTLSAGTKLDIEFVAGVVSKVKLQKEKTGEYKIESIDTRYNKIVLSKANQWGAYEKKEFDLASNVHSEDQLGYKISLSDALVGYTVDITTGSYSTITRLVVYTNSNKGKFLITEATTRRIYVKDSLNNSRETSYPLASSYSIDGKTYYGNLDTYLSSYLTNRYANIELNRNDEVVAIYTSGDVNNKGVSVDTTISNIYGKNSIGVRRNTREGYKYLTSTTNTRYYIDGTVVTFEQAYNMISRSLNKKSTAVYGYNGVVEELYLESDYYKGTERAMLIRMEDRFNTVLLTFNLDSGKTLTKEIYKTDPIYNSLSRYSIYNLRIDSYYNIIDISLAN